MSSRMPLQTGGHPIPVLNPGRTITSTIGASSTEVDLGTAFSPQSTASVFRLQSSVAVHIRTAAGDATTSDMPMASDLPENFKFAADATFRQIQASTGGTLWITEML